MQTLPKMNTDKFGRLIFDQDDVFSLLMQGKDIANAHIIVDEQLLPQSVAELLETVPTFISYPDDTEVPVEDWDRKQQSHWYMPESYQNLDIAQYILDLCKTDAELQRVGHELLLYQERNLFDLLKYLTYLVDVMRDNNIIWGVGRGSSVASYVLYLLGVHKIDSMYYDLEPEEFLR